MYNISLANISEGYIRFICIIGSKVLKNSTPIHFIDKNIHEKFMTLKIGYLLREGQAICINI